MVWITSAKYLGEYRIHLQFNDSAQGVADLKDAIFSDPRSIFQALRDTDYFRRFKVDMDTIVWENGLDLAPEFLYELLRTPAAAKLSRVAEDSKSYGQTS